MVVRFFSEEYIENLKPYVQKTVQDLLTTVEAKGCDEPVDLIESFALPVPSYVSHQPPASRRDRGSFLPVRGRSSTRFLVFRSKISSI